MSDRYSDVNVIVLQSEILSCKEDIMNLNKLVQSNSITASLNDTVWSSLSKDKFLPFIEDIELDYREISTKLNELELIIFSIKEYKSLVLEYNNLSSKITALERIKNENRDNEDFNAYYNYTQINNLTFSRNNLNNKINNLINLIES